MHRLSANKRLVSLAALLGLGALTLLAISLDRVPFRQGQQFGRNVRSEMDLSAAQVQQVWAEVPLWEQIVLWLLVSFVVVLVGLLLSPELRKRFFRLMIRMAITVWGIYFLFKNYGDRLLGLDLQGDPADSAGTADALPIPVFEPPHISPLFSYLLSFGVALLWIVLLGLLYRGWQRYRHNNTARPLDEIARIARASLDDLSSGRNSSDVIVNCYLRMSDVVSSRRQLRRDIAMTPHEFALRLEQAGLPGEAVRRLTGLFEAVRYGDRKSAPRDITEAVRCLKTILQYCGEPV